MAAAAGRAISAARLFLDLVGVIAIGAALDDLHDESHRIVQFVLGGGLGDH